MAARRLLLISIPFAKHPRRGKSGQWDSGKPRMPARRSPWSTFQSPKSGQWDSFSGFLIALNHRYSHYSTFLQPLVQTLRTSEAEHENSRETPGRGLGGASPNRFGTPSNSSFPLQSRFANGNRFGSQLRRFARITLAAYNAAQGDRNVRTESVTYPAIYIIFTLLNAIRRGIERKNLWREFRRQQIPLKPRLSFWIAVCREAGLVKDDAGYDASTALGARLRVTSYARRWLNKTPEEQAFHLIESWQNAPKNHRVRMFRRKLLWKLKYDKPLTSKDLGALNGLEALGLVTGGKMTKWGRFFINPARTARKGFEACGVKGEGELPTPKTAQPCKIQEEQFIASIPDHADLLWDIERYLRPKSPGTYPLTKRALQFQSGNPDELIELLERGLGRPLPGQIKALVLNQPSIRIADGVVLEFSSPSELRQLRRQPAFRKYIGEFLSPQRILVSREKAKGLFQMLTRRGVYVHWNEEQTDGSQKRTRFPQKQQVLQPIGKQVPKLEIIEEYKKLGQALEVWYRAPGCPAEKRRITPLLIEERGGQTYVIAYCQTRRAQRTFRLDRMEVPGTW